MDDEWPIESYNMDDLWTIYEWDFYELLMPSPDIAYFDGW